MNRFVPILAAGLFLIGGVGPARGTEDERPRNGRILITDGVGIIASIRADGSGRRALLERDDYPFGAVWSPDKKRIAYGLYGPEGSELYVMTASGEGDRLIDYADSWEWSPDGRYLAYSATTGMSPIDGCQGIWLMDMETSETRELADAPDCKIPKHLEWSPDSAEIAFVNDDDIEENDAEVDIYQVHVVSGAITQLTESPGVDAFPAWSPDGAWILFWTDRDHVIDGVRSHGEVYRMLVDGSGQERVTHDLSRGDGPASWSPDGRRIVWTGSVRRPDKGAFPGAAVHLMKVDGGNVTRLTDGRRFGSTEPHYSPDGRWLLFYGYPKRADEFDYALYKSRLDGSDRTRLTRVGTHWTFSDW